MTASVDERHGRALGWYRLPLGLVFTLGAVALLVTLSVPLIFGNLCANTLHDEFKAPDGRRAALAFDIDCGATTAFNAQVSILPRSLLVPAGSTALDGGNALVIDTDHRPDVSLAVRVRWTGTREVELTYDRRARVFLTREQVGDVAVRHVRVILPPPSTERGR